MAKEIAIKVQGVSKNFILPHQKVRSVKSLFTTMFRPSGSTLEVQHALKDISFEVRKGEFFGIVGRNGSGKSTMLKILAGIYQPTEGSVTTTGKLVPFIELGVGFNPELTGRENVYLNGAMLGFSQKEVAAMYDDIVAFAELERFMDQKLKNYSSGMQVRLAFSMATRAEADILLVDEVLAVGDADFQRKCFDYFRMLKKNKKTVVFVSHDMTAVREYCDRAVLIEQNELILEGDANKVGTAYTRMFMEQAEDAGDAPAQNSKRWGDGVAKYGKVSLSKRLLTSDDKTMTLRVTATILKDIDNPLVGFSIKNASGVQVLGTNNQIKKVPIEGLKAGQRLDVTWTIDNIFGEGRHYVDCAFVHHDGSSVADWWEEAAQFNVINEEKTPYMVSPPISLSVDVKQGKD
jgi:ABC-2 type transport system ATP-binding protein